MTLAGPLAALLAFAVPGPAFAQGLDLRDGAGNPVPRNLGTPGRSGSFSGAGYVGGSFAHGAWRGGGAAGERRETDGAFGDRVR